MVEDEDEEPDEIPASVEKLLSLAVPLERLFLEVQKLAESTLPRVPLTPKGDYEYAAIYVVSVMVQDKIGGKPVSDSSTIEVVRAVSKVLGGRLEESLPGSDELVMVDLPQLDGVTIQLSCALLEREAARWPSYAPGAVAAVLIEVLRAVYKTPDGLQKGIGLVCCNRSPEFRQAPWLWSKKPLIPVGSHSISPEPFTLGYSGNAGKYGAVEFTPPTDLSSEVAGLWFDGTLHRPNVVPGKLVDALRDSDIGYPVVVPTRSATGARATLRSWIIPPRIFVVAAVQVANRRLSEDDTAVVKSEAEALHAALKHNKDCVTAVLVYCVTDPTAVYIAMRQVPLDYVRDVLKSDFCFLADDNLCRLYRVPHRYNATDTTSMTGLLRDQIELTPVLRMLAAAARTWSQTSDAGPLGALGVRGFDHLLATKEFGDKRVLRRGHVKWLGIFSTAAAKAVPYRMRSKTDVGAGALFKSEDQFSSAGPCEDLCRSFDLNKKGYFVGNFRLYWLSKQQ
eukprot:m.11869 g.11869  ORF g.11869 m.11869 type:complete len:508 (+) comp7551_c0_seq1:1295-2818(+)